MGSFNRVAAAQYAQIWAVRRNPNFPDFSSSGGGGDCTNFVSQVMLAGGWTMIEGGKRDSGSWWCHGDEASHAWASASHFADFLEKSGRGSICTRSDLELGDVVQMSTYGSRIHHTMVVSSLLCGPDGDEIYVSYHTRDNLNKSLNQIEADNAHNDQMFFYWKIAENFYPVATKEPAPVPQFRFRH
jgi:hypothetical protein